MTNYDRNEAEILRRESERTGKYPSISFRKYDTSLEGFVVIPVKPEADEKTLAALGYSRVSAKEIRETKGLQRYPKLELFKISWQNLEEIHS